MMQLSLLAPEVLLGMQALRSSYVPNRVERPADLPRLRESAETMERRVLEWFEAQRARFERTGASEDVWTDVARMRTLNMHQAHKGQEMHLCPLQFDIVDRLIVQLSNQGETVYDPFGGLMTVPYCAIKLGREAVATELNPRYFADGVAYVEAAVREASIPTLFDMDEPAA